MWKISRPVALVVSMFSWSNCKPMPRTCKAFTVVRIWRIGSRQTIEPGDDVEVTHKS